MKSIKVLFNGLELHLLAGRAIWAPSLGCLFVADTHFGKATTFRQMGIAVPAGTTALMLQRLDNLLSNTTAKRLIVLGDWIHHSKTAQKDYVDELTEWRNRWQSLEITCVEGNHDRYNRPLISKLSIELVAEETLLEQLLLCHYPADTLQTASTQTEKLDWDHDTREIKIHGSKNERLRLCGHLHPGVKLPIAPKMLRSFPCFVVGNCQIILPAFGEFTGLAKVNSSSSMKRIACLSDQKLLVVHEAVEQLSG